MVNRGDRLTVRGKVIEVDMVGVFGEIWCSLPGSPPTRIPQEAWDTFVTPLVEAGRVTVESVTSNKKFRSGDGLSLHRRVKR